MCPLKQDLPGVKNFMGICLNLYGAVYLRQNFKMVINVIQMKY